MVYTYVSVVYFYQIMHADTHIQLDEQSVWINYTDSTKRTNIMLTLVK